MASLEFAAEWLYPFYVPLLWSPLSFSSHVIYMLFNWKIKDCIRTLAREGNLTWKMKTELQSDFTCMQCIQPQKHFTFCRGQRVRRSRKISLAFSELLPRSDLSFVLSTKSVHLKIIARWPLEVESLLCIQFSKCCQEHQLMIKVLWNTTL